MRNKLIDSTRGACIIMVILYHFHVASFFDKNGLYGLDFFYNKRVLHGEEHPE